MENNNMKTNSYFFARNHVSIRERVSTKKYWVSLAGILLALLFSSWLMFHTFSYDNKTHEIKIAYKIWSDFGAHIPLIRSFSMGENLPRILQGKIPEYPIFPGEPIRYHYLFYMVVGILEKLGLRIDWALNIPSIAGFTALLVTLFVLAKKLTGSTLAAIFTLLFFLLNGSLGFQRFFTLHPINMYSYMDVYHAKEFPAFAPWGPGEITAFWNLNIYTNQRHLAAAFSLILLFILTCMRINGVSFKKQIPWIVFWGLVFGILPYFHQPTLLIVAIIMATYIILFPKLRLFLFTTGILTTILVVPQLFGQGGSGNPAMWYPGYIIHNELIAQNNIFLQLRHMATFWWQNLGLHSVLILIGFFLIPPKSRKYLIPMIPLFLIPNLFKFSIEASANHKFFNFFLALGNIISANLIVLLIKQIKTLIIRLPARHRFAQAIAGGFAYSLICLLLIPLTLSGVIDFFVIANDTLGSLSDIPKNVTATWITNNTPKDAVFLNSSYIFHPASLAGRAIFLGWPYFSWSAGYPDGRSAIMKKIYESKNPDIFCPLLQTNNISYVTVEDTRGDKNLPAIDPKYYKNTFRAAYTSQDGSFAIFQTKDLCLP